MTQPAAARSTLASQAQRVRFGFFEADLRSRELWRNGAKVRLPDQPFHVLALLLERPGDLVTREELRQRLWPGDTFVEFDLSLNSAVRKLRDALGDSADQPTFVETLPRRGYRFIAAVEAPPAPSSIPVAPPEPRAALNISKELGAYFMFRRRSIIITATLAVAVLAASVVVWRVRTAGAPGPSTIPRVAVLPLANLTGDSAEEYLADGLTEELIGELGRTGGLQVIARSSVTPYRDAQVPVETIARELDVDAIVKGALDRSGSHLRISVQFIPVRTGRPAWSQSYERDLSDLRELQYEIARSICAAAGGRAASPMAPTPTRRPVSEDAYRLFFRARLAAIGDRGAQGYRDAVALSQEVIDKQPDFAEAYVSLAWYYHQMYVFGESPMEFAREMETAAYQALSLDQRLPGAYSILGVARWRFHRDWTGAEKAFKDALALNSNDAQAHRLFANFLWTVRREKEALSEALQAQSLDPVSLGSGLAVGQAYRVAGDYDQAIKVFLKTLEKGSQVSAAHFQLGLTYLLAGKLQDGVRELETSVKLGPNNLRYQAYTAYAYAVSGRPTDAQEILDKLLAMDGRRYVPPTAVAHIFAGLGVPHAAVSWLKKAYQEYDPDLAGPFTKVALKDLQPLPEYRAIFARMGLDRNTLISEK